MIRVEGFERQAMAWHGKLFYFSPFLAPWDAGKCGMLNVRWIVPTWDAGARISFLSPEGTVCHNFFSFFTTLSMGVPQNILIEGMKKRRMWKGSI